MWRVAVRRLISDEVADFIESGLSINIGTRNGKLEPDGAIAWAVQVHADRSQLTLYLHKEAAKAMLRNLRVHPEIAVLFERPTSHRACQVKGSFVSKRPAKPPERAKVERQMDGFFSDLEGIGIPRALLAELEVWPCVAIQIRATELFEQTPGPGAGEPLR
jgi:Pyridoxamine 5'-phosphate oxidase